MTHCLIRVFALVALALGHWSPRAVAEEAGRGTEEKAVVFLPFDFYPRHREELGLSAEQIGEMQRLADSVREAAQPIEAERARHTKTLQQVMAQSPIDVAKAMDCFHAVLQAEDQMKALQFRSGLAMRNALTAEQAGKLPVLARKENASRGAGVFSERLQQLRAEIRKRTGGEPPRGIVEQVEQIEQAAKEGRLGEAKNQLEQVLRQLRGEPGSGAAAEETTRNK